MRDVDELMGLVDIAQLLGLSRARADQLARQKGFPDSTIINGRIRVWARTEVEQWARDNGRIK